MAATIDSAVLLTASRSHLLSSYATFTGKTASNWLIPGHPLANGSLPTNWPAVRRIPDIQVIQGLAAVTPNHCLDGWGYASRSLSALMAGDSHASRHLSYYAQLRAAMAILGNLGVGIFNGINFVVTSGGSLTRLDPDPANLASRRGAGTHQIVWAALEAWTQATGSAAELLKLIKVSGNSLLDCLNAVFPGTSSVGIAGSLLSIWGLDLRRGEDEHRYRNISSYVPHSLNTIASPVKETLDFVEHAWRLFEPTSPSCFDQLDRHILRLVLTEQLRISGISASKKRGLLGKRYEDLPDTVRSIVTKDFLLKKEEPDDPLLIRAARDRSSPANATSMLARALLLLRVCTATTLSSFVDAGVTCTSGELRPWLDELALIRGFWAPSGRLDDTRDLWIDVEVALHDFAGSRTPDPTSLYAWLTIPDKGLPTLAEAERIGLWSLGG